MSVVQKGIVSYTVGASALTKHTRVKLSAGLLVVAGAGEHAIGVVQDNAAAGEIVALRLFSDSGTFLMTASAAITANAVVYGSASGKISSTVSGTAIGIAREAATADGNIIEVQPTENAGAPYIMTKVAVAGDATNGYIDFDPGFGAAPTARMALAYAVTTGAPRTIASVLPNSTALRVTVTSLATGDTVTAIMDR
jgi:hypothetical protein